MARPRKAASIELEEIIRNGGGLTVAQIAEKLTEEVRSSMGDDWRHRVGIYVSKLVAYRRARWEERNGIRVYLPPDGSFLLGRYWR